MSVSTKVLNRWGRCGPKVRAADPDLTAVAPSAPATPSGPEAAAAAFAWLNRQVSWQSTLAELEGARAQTGAVPSLTSSASR
jgi:hypothetical protein